MEKSGSNQVIHLVFKTYLFYICTSFFFSKENQDCDLEFVRCLLFANVVYTCSDTALHVQLYLKKFSSLPSLFKTEVIVSHNVVLLVAQV